MKRIRGGRNRNESNEDEKERLYSELCLPLKDRAKSFSIDIGKALLNLSQEDINLSDAALIVKGASEKYGYKIDLLQKLVDQLNSDLVTATSRNGTESEEINSSDDAEPPDGVESTPSALPRRMVRSNVASKEDARQKMSDFARYWAEDIEIARFDSDHAPNATYDPSKPPDILDMSVILREDSGLKLLVRVPHHFTASTIITEPSIVDVDGENIGRPTDVQILNCEQSGSILNRRKDLTDLFGELRDVGEHFFATIASPECSQSQVSFHSAPEEFPLVDIDDSRSMNPLSPASQDLGSHDMSILSPLSDFPSSPHSSFDGGMTSTPIRPLLLSIPEVEESENRPNSQFAISEETSTVSDSGNVTARDGVSFNGFDAATLSSDTVVVENSVRASNSENGIADEQQAETTIDFGSIADSLLEDCPEEERLLVQATPRGAIPINNRSAPLLPVDSAKRRNLRKRLRNPFDLESSSSSSFSDIYAKPSKRRKTAKSSLKLPEKKSIAEVLSSSALERGTGAFFSQSSSEAVTAEDDPAELPDGLISPLRDASPASSHGVYPSIEDGPSYPITSPALDSSQELDVDPDLFRNSQEDNRSEQNFDAAALSIDYLASPPIGFDASSPNPPLDNMEDLEMTPSLGFSSQILSESRLLPVDPATPVIDARELALKVEHQSKRPEFNIRDTCVSIINKSQETTDRRLTFSELYGGRPYDISRAFVSILSLASVVDRKSGKYDIEMEHQSSESTDFTIKVNATREDRSKDELLNIDGAPTTSKKKSRSIKRTAQPSVEQRLRESSEENESIVSVKKSRKSSSRQVLRPKSPQTVDRGSQESDSSSVDSSDIPHLILEA